MSPRLRLRRVANKSYFYKPALSASEWNTFFTKRIYFPFWSHLVLELSVPG